MERGCRYRTLFESLDKLNNHRSSVRSNSDDIQQYRYNSSKLLNCVNTQDKLNRDSLVKNGGYVDTLITTLELASDSTVLHNIVLVVIELIGRAQVGKRASIFVAHGATQVLFHVLVQESKEQSSHPDFIISCHQALAKLGPKDRKFGVKARLGQALGVTLGMIRNHLSGYKVLQPLLHVLKLYSANAVNASYLGKNGAVTYLFKILQICGRKHLTIVKHALDTLGLLVKSKSNSARAVGQGGVPILLTMFYDWHRADTKNRHIALRKSILSVLRHIINLKSGRKALMEADGIRFLYTACQESVEVRELESLIFTASFIMRRCFPKNKMPVPAVRSTLVFPLPESDFHIIEVCPEALASTKPHSSPLAATADDNGDDSSVDNDDDISSEEDQLDQKKRADSEDEEVGNEPPYLRTATDLQMYQKFFPELFEFEAGSDDEDTADKPIVIPTAESGRATLPPTSRPQRSVKSADSISRRNPILQDCPSLPKFPTFSTSEDCSSVYKLDTSYPFDLDFPNSRNRTSKITENSVSGNSSEGAATNFKSGATVISLSPKVSPTSARRPSNSALGAKSGVSNSSASGSRGSKKTSVSKNLKYPPRRRSRTRSDDGNGFLECSGSSISFGGASSETGDENMIDDFEEEYDCTNDSPEIVREIASNTVTVGRMSKIAYPDLHGHRPPPFPEPQYDRKFGVQRAKIFEDIDRMINPDTVIDRVVYNMDALVSSAQGTYTSAYSNLTNRDELRVSRAEDYSDALNFNAQFESGNLRRVIQVRQYEYDLILSPDINTNHHHQWFYFEISNMEAGIKYRFNIVNCEKPNSQFNFGMQPVMYSVAEAVAGRPHWVRAGTDICYYKNHFLRSSQTTGGVPGKMFYTTTFTVKFQHENDVCYLAYHYPYTYTMLQTHIYKWENGIDASNIYFRNQSLCDTLSGNSVPVLTITSYPQSNSAESLEQFRNRPYIFLSGRVHPGESNASWVMKGTIQFLLCDKPAAQALRDMYVFKIVPMLNPDGVVNGNHRCSLTAEDLNRRWLHPCPKLHPTIYHTKGLLQYLHMIGKNPLVYCDYHGHSRRKNTFLYGCSPSQSWQTEDVDNPTVIGTKLEDVGYKTLPKILQNSAPCFSLSNCSNIVEKTKEGSARVVVWRQIRIVRSYTMESSYCGCDQGQYRGLHISTRELEEMGRKFAEALLKIKNTRSRPSDSSTTLQIQSSDTREDQGLELQGATAGELVDDLDGGESTSSDEDQYEEDDEEEEDDIDVF
ncbi:cytosolic carboxypeptidase 1-like isoform X2 [Lineus longissimus]|uniref:cytosolic carboxypeptidase 1-like isoform X2 n=1 Tax=Lineus longissimus TaxID=88925 RepID=UPI002B4C7E73